MKAVCLIAVGIVGIQLAGFGHGKREINNQIGGLKGQVFVTNNPELGRTPASGMYFVLQRTDCPRCLIGVRTDVDGKYNVYLGVGKYQISCDAGQYGEVDLIRKGQTREVTVLPPPTDTQFNLDLEIPSSWQK